MNSQNSELTLEDKYPRGVRLVEYFCRNSVYYKREILSDYAKVVEAWDCAIRDLTDDQVRNGCKSWMNGGVDFVPAPPRFRYKCFGFLDSDLAYDLAKQDANASQEIYGSRTKITNYQWSHLPDFDRKRLFLKHYAAICEAIMSGLVIDVPVSNSGVAKLPEYISRKKCVTEAGLDAIKSIKEILRGEKNGD